MIEENNSKIDQKNKDTIKTAAWANTIVSLLLLAPKTSHHLFHLQHQLSGLKDSNPCQSLSVNS